MSKRIGIVDYGSGNIYSLQRGVRAVGYEATIITDPGSLTEYDCLILPGVGAFGDAMEKIRKRELERPLAEYVASGRPLLGICLGMQLLLSKSHELGIHQGLGFIDGEVREIPRTTGVMIPHIGWVVLIPRSDWKHTALENISPKDEFYFVHSFTCHPLDQKAVLATCLYGDYEFVSVIGQRNVFGCQFHPEMSSKPGLRLLRDFMNL